MTDHYGVPTVYMTRVNTLAIFGNPGILGKQSQN